MSLTAFGFTRSRNTNNTNTFSNSNKNKGKNSSINNDSNVPRTSQSTLLFSGDQHINSPLRRSPRSQDKVDYISCDTHNNTVKRTFLGFAKKSDEEEDKFSFKSKRSKTIRSNQNSNNSIIIDESSVDSEALNFTEQSHPQNKRVKLRKSKGRQDESNKSTERNNETNSKKKSRTNNSTAKAEQEEEAPANTLPDSVRRSSRNRSKALSYNEEELLNHLEQSNTQLNNEEDNKHVENSVEEEANPQASASKSKKRAKAVVNSKNNNSTFHAVPAYLSQPRYNFFSCLESRRCHLLRASSSTIDARLFSTLPWVFSQRSRANLLQLEAEIGAEEFARSEAAKAGVKVLNRFDTGKSDWAAWCLGVDHTGQIIAAGGKRGVCKLFIRPQTGEHQQNNSNSSENSIVSEWESDYLPASASFQAHSRWQSTVIFVSPRYSTQEYGQTFLTAADDGAINLFSAEQIMAQQYEANNTTNSSEILQVSPISSAGSEQLHGAGIYCADLYENKIASSGKDSSVIISQLAQSEIIGNTLQLSGVHSQTVKHVSWRCENVLASCSNDKSVAVYDLRISSRDKCVLHIPQLHDLAVNTVLWRPMESHFLLSSSFDKSIAMIDLRRISYHFNPSSRPVAKPINSIEEEDEILSSQSTVHSTLTNSYSHNAVEPIFRITRHFQNCAGKAPILHPIFYNSGTSILCANNATTLFNFSSSTGELVKTIPLGYTAMQLCAYENSRAIEENALISYHKRHLFMMNLI
jgi:hypothetical protein